MQKYIALLRGINVGGNKKVPMAELKMVLENAGYKNIKTLLASGNVVLESDIGIDELPTVISASIERAFGFPVPVLVRDFKDIEKIISLNPFKGIRVTPQTRLYVTFISEKSNDKISLPFFSSDKSFKIISSSNKTIFSALDLSVSKTPEAMNTLEKIYGKNVTTRNWNTILKIAKL